MRYVPIELNNPRLIIFFKSLEISNRDLKYNAIMANKRSSLKWSPLIVELFFAQICTEYILAVQQCINRLIPPIILIILS